MVKKQARRAKKTRVPNRRDTGRILTWKAVRDMTGKLIGKHVPGGQKAAMTGEGPGGIARQVSEARAVRRPSMPAAPFGTASTSAPYYARPCNERLASLPEALMQLAEGK